jgi:UDP-N-acetylmuramoyl-tripeptide--D-alanyl-D-alanine ligase
VEATVKEILEILQATLVAGSDTVRVKHVFTDTRKPIKGALFVALKGENFDGDLYADTALTSGASVALVNKWNGGSVAENQAVICVPDTLLALQKLAHWWRSTLDIPVVCITGSNGKTSTKDFAKAVLSQQFFVNATQGNLNNHIGLPLSVLATGPEHTAAIFEIGMNHSGELAPLCDIARPHFGIITNIGTAHIEFLGSREAIAEEKGTLARCLTEDGLLITPSDCDFNDYFLSTLRGQHLSVDYGSNSVMAENIVQQADGTRFNLCIAGEEKKEVFLPVLGRHMLTNALLAAALGWKLGISVDKIARGLSNPNISSGRLRRLACDGITLLDDTYNANPESMAAAIETLAHISVAPESQRILVLGKMGELGDHAATAHLQIGKLAAQSGLLTIAVGQGAEGIAKGANAAHFPDFKTAAEWLQTNAKCGDVVLFKGSRSASIEKVLQLAYPSAC